jgi:hypothetical protein
MKLQREKVAMVRNIINQLPKDESAWIDLMSRPYELFIYTKTGDGDYDLKDFDVFDGIGQLQKVCNKIVNTYGKELHCIDFKYFHPTYDFDQVTIYQN